MQDYAFRRLREEPILLALLNYWERKRADKEVPDRRDIDPTEMPPFLLPHLCLIEICENDRLKLRLVGTEIVRQHRRDNTGKYADEYLKGDYLAYLTALYVELRRKRLPILTESVFRHPDTHLETTRLLLPLTLGGADVRIVLMGQIFRYPAAAQSRRSPSRSMPARWRSSTRSRSTASRAARRGGTGDQDRMTAMPVAVKRMAIV
jgi:hypothetical protein